MTISLQSLLDDAKCDWECWIAGDGPYLPTLKALAAELGAPVRFLGMVPRRELPALYQSSKVFVFPALRENFPMVLLEAMAAGCAVVTTSAAGCAEVVGDAAIGVAPGNDEALREALEDLLTDETVIDQLRDRERRRIARFASTKIVQEYEAVFRRCLAEAWGPV